MIMIEGLYKRYKKHVALRDINLRIDKGIFGLLGPNGAGKTSLMRILATLLKPTSGEVTVHGISLTKQPDEIRKLIGYLPQHFQIYPQLTAYDFLDYVGVMKGIKEKKERENRIKHLLAEVNLQQAARQKIKTFSGGMKQRLGIAQALLGDPAVLIVDEPTAGLDPEERIRFRNLISRLGMERIVILSTHIVADIESSCQSLAVLSQGRVVLTGTLEDLRQQAADKVWELEIEERELERYHQYPIVSTRRTDHGVRVKVIAGEKPAPSAIPLSPSLEEGYMALIGGKADE
ncbi:ABC transporter ATP-binding protein [Caldalkalibacillus thermarum]|uniref:ABC transporter ATP-binding protein n=1 Tax=Caldalkalibacillus thermarum TaxID=296745 RepID=UPI00166C42AA|nr:ABC transporter ATP-binding protein [Caldalkalibacillus thermarum]GGK12006.1 ABC transporter ATP-binding protein [Caldalkalibacillus thermarum]